MSPPSAALTVLIELLRQILVEASQPAWLEALKSREQRQAQKLVERLSDNLHELVELRQTAAEALPSWRQEKTAS